MYDSTRPWVRIISIVHRLKEKNVIFYEIKYIFIFKNRNIIMIVLW